MKIALITEGVSEYTIIEHIMFGYIGDDNLIINQIQPKVVNQRQVTAGGWAEVIAYCQRPEIHDILIENDFLIVQIDSDQSQTPPFSVNHIDNQSEQKEPDQLLRDIIERLQSLFIHEIYQKFQSRIIFAICIHTIECWLLPVVLNDHHRSSTTNCMNRLNRELARRNMNGIPPKGDHMRIRRLEEVLHLLRKKRDIMNAAQFNPGFRFFIESIREQMDV
jgi:hypothetical protein